MTSFIKCLTEKSPKLLFLHGFVRDWRQTGSLIPSSRYLARAMLDEVDWSKASFIVELGPGTGVLTRAILERLSPDGILIAIEADQAFAAFLKRSLADPRLIVVTGDAGQLETHLRKFQLGLADAVISSLPWRSLRRVQREAALLAVAASLAPSGTFVTYQYSLRLVETIAARFPGLKRRRVWRNWPPAYVLLAQRTGVRWTC